jgi:hypothetical protein
MCTGAQGLRQGREYDNGDAVTRQHHWRRGEYALLCHTLMQKNMEPLL